MIDETVGELTKVDFKLACSLLRCARRVHSRIAAHGLRYSDAMQQLRRYLPSDGIDAIMQGLAADGGVIVRDFIDADPLRRPSRASMCRR